MTKDVKFKDLISLDLLTHDDIRKILDVARYQKDELRSLGGTGKQILKGKTLAMIFEKSSLRTRVTFEVAMLHLGGTAIYLSQDNFKLGERETVEDVARNLERWVDGIMVRTFAHDNVTKMAAAVSIPVINGLTDYAHPCQALADVLTIKEHKGTLEGRKVAFIGDGNNVATSLSSACAHTGMHFVCASPEGYVLSPAVVAKARALAADTGATIETTTDPKAALEGADVVYTDVWTSMGQEKEKEERLKAFAAYQVNGKLLALAKPDAIVLHCLPAHRGEEITDEVLDGPQSAVLDQSENRLHAQKAVLSLLM